jgi:hypothetical protein
LATSSGENLTPPQENTLKTKEEIEEDTTREATYRAIGLFIHQFASIEWTL